MPLAESPRPASLAVAEARPGKRASATHSATNTNVAASTASAHTAPAAAISRPAVALPTSAAVSRAVAKAPCAVVSRSLPTTDGIIEARAGCMNVVRPFSLKMATKATKGGR